jgi:hypothetical protein
MIQGPGNLLLKRRAHTCDVGHALCPSYLYVTLALGENSVLECFKIQVIINVSQSLRSCQPLASGLGRRDTRLSARCVVRHAVSAGAGGAAEKGVPPDGGVVTKPNLIARAPAMMACESKYGS